MNWVLNIIGVAIFFINRYGNRTVKSRFNRNTWVRENWRPVVSMLLFDVALMILLLQPETQIGIDNLLKEYIPFVALQVSAKLVVSFLIGLFFAAAFYKLFKKKKS